MKVSIITATYNSRETVDRTIESVLQQSYPDIEYWVIDGNSTDGTVDKLKQYENRFERRLHGKFHWISEPDNGIYDAMNKGIERSTGDIVGLLNSDDWFTTNDVVEKIVKAFTDDIDAVYGDIHTVQKEAPDVCSYRCNSRIFRPYLLKFGWAPPHPSFYVRRSIIKAYGAYDPTYKIAGDFELIARYIHRHHIHTKYIPMDFVTMTTGGASTKDAQAYKDGIREVSQACKELGIHTNGLKLSMKRFISMVANRI